MEMRERQRQLFLLLGALLLVSCATVEAPGRATEQPEAIILGMGTADGSCATTLCCSNCPITLLHKNFIFGEIGDQQSPFWDKFGPH